MEMKLLNNITETVCEDMQKNIGKQSKVSMSASCFSMYAYNLLKKQLNLVDEFRFIFTAPTFIEEKKNKSKREFYIPKLNREKSLYGTEFEIKLRNEMTQRAVAKECAAWIRKCAKFKSNTTGENMIGFTVVESGREKFVYNPINEFTTAGIGCERGNNAYNMVTRINDSVAESFLQIFNSLWNDNQKFEDVTEKVIENISTAYNENSPELIYFMTLYNVFKEFLEDISEDFLPNEATGFKKSKIWSMLYDFQRDAVLAIINKLEQYNGCILADSVGLGKTFSALAIIKYYENRNKSVLVLCPKKLLELKNLISKTSVKKYEAMLNMVNSDNRARGMFQFYGANRTGRFTGKGIQLQNLPQNHLEDLDTARQFVKNTDLNALEIFYSNPSNVLSELIRTAFIAEENHRFIVADFSAIEARVIAWLADEQWRMKIFEQGGDIYCASATAMFKVPVEKHGANKELRAKGKIAELACGYGGGVNALKAFGADKMGLSDFEMETIIKKWRESSPNICKFWREVEICAKNAILEKKFVEYKKNISFESDGNFLFINLPSGRKISYVRPKIILENNQEKITYQGTIQETGGWGKNYTWGGKLTENIVQATARDCLAESMIKLDKAGYKIVMHVHDEIISEMVNGKGSLEEVVSIMSEPISWAKGLILTADGYETEYYRKD